ncbi:hypothetical protein [Streptomyces sp. NPDC050564]
MLPIRYCQECDSYGDGAVHSVTGVSAASRASASLESRTPEGSLADTM